MADEKSNACKIVVDEIPSVVIVVGVKITHHSEIKGNKRLYRREVVVDEIAQVSEIVVDQVFNRRQVVGNKIPRLVVIVVNPIDDLPVKAIKERPELAIIDNNKPAQSQIVNV